MREEYACVILTPHILIFGMQHTCVIINLLLVFMPRDNTLKLRYDFFSIATSQTDLFLMHLNRLKLFLYHRLCFLFFLPFFISKICSLNYARNVLSFFYLRFLFCVPSHLAPVRTFSDGMVNPACNRYNTTNTNEKREWIQQEEEGKNEIKIIYTTLKVIWKKERRRSKQKKPAVAFEFVNKW